MDRGEVVDIAIAIPFVIMFALCALAMLRAVFGGDGGHGMMMCMGRRRHDTGTADRRLFDEMKGERHRLDELVARTEREAAERGRT
jgi:hypothetical protein